MIKLKPLITEELSKIGYSPDEEYSDMPINWDESDIQMGRKWDIPTIKEFLGLPKNYQSIYQAIVDVNELNPRLAEKDPEFNDGEDEDGGYNWDGYGMRKRGFPPILIKRKNGKLIIMDGNHRVTWAQNVGYDTIAAWVVDDDLENHHKNK